MPTTAEAPLADPPRRSGDASTGVLLDQRFDAGTLHQLRAAVLAHAARAGALRCQVLDPGVASPDVASPDGRAGDTVDGPPPWPSPEGHGLWLVRQVADQFSIVPWHGGYCITAQFTMTD